MRRGGQLGRWSGWRAGRGRDARDHSSCCARVGCTGRRLGGRPLPLSRRESPPRDATTPDRQARGAQRRHAPTPTDSDSGLRRDDPPRTRPGTPEPHPHRRRACHRPPTPLAAGADARRIRRRRITRTRPRPRPTPTPAGGHLPQRRHTVSGVLLVPRGTGRSRRSCSPTGTSTRRSTRRAGDVPGAGLAGRRRVRGAAHRLRRSRRVRPGRRPRPRVPAGLHPRRHRRGGSRREPVVDPGRLAMFGRSMGGGVTYNALVTAPGLVDAAVVWAGQLAVPRQPAPVHGARTGPRRRGAVRPVRHARGAPGVYADLSPRWFLDRVTEPVLILHGDSDEHLPAAVVPGDPRRCPGRGGRRADRVRR